MRHLGVQIVHAAVLAASVLLAFLVMQDLDTEPPPGAAGTISIQDARKGADGTRAVRLVDAYARDHHVSVVREVWDLRQPDRLRRFYIATGDPGSAPASWLERGFPSFGHRVRTETLPFAQAASVDPKGEYQVYGPERAIVELRAALADSGFDGEIVRPTGPKKYLQRYAHESLGAAYLAAALSVVLTVGASVLLGAKDYGVLLLQGMSFLEILWRDLRRLLPFWLVTAVTIAVAATACLDHYNGLIRFGLFALVAGALAGTLVALSLVTRAGALALVFHGGVLRALKGQVTPRPALAGVYLVRIGAVLLVLSVGATAVASAREYADRRASRERFAALGQATSIVLSRERTEEPLARSHRVGSWLRRADARGRVVAVHRWRLREFGGVPLPDGEVLAVNDTFLAEQPILDEAGRRYGPDPRHRVRVIVPERLRDHANTVYANVPGVIHPEQRGKPVDEAGVDQLWAKDGQKVFTFGARSKQLGRTLVRDPVVVVVPNGSPLISDDEFAARANQNGIVFKNPSDVVAALGRDILKADIAGMRPVAQGAADDYTAAVRDLRIEALSLVAALVALFLTGIGVCVVHTGRNAQAVFAKHISGWSFWMIHRGLFVLDGLVATGLLLKSVRTMSDRAEAIKWFTDRDTPPPPHLPSAHWWDLTPSLGVAVLSTALLVAALAHAHRRVVAGHAADA
ncbi:hypothetical protein [Actinomadura terrae]|uniref:hypothetical protein n=1 Tax=Actinomadura terrae TaxID=604353 RepID=UPI001FA77390|nr:hypothetical protein [Actinomadura terrae]